MLPHKKHTIKGAAHLLLLSGGYSVLSLGTDAKTTNNYLSCVIQW